MKDKKVEGHWYSEVYLDAQCPHCNKRLDEFELDIEEGEAVKDELIKCPECKKLFILNVDQL